MKDGAELKEDSRVVVNRDFAPHGSYEITIHKVGDADAGQYTAVASNTVGKEECSCQVSVKGEFEPFIWWVDQFKFQLLFFSETLGNGG